MRPSPAVQLGRWAKDCTTLGVGGPIRWWWPVTTAGEVRRGLAFAQAQGVPWWVLGGGSNVIVADSGLSGVVLHPAPPVKSIVIAGESGEGVRLHVAAGVQWDDLVAWSIAQGLQGLECLSGIPGQVGAAPIQNIGAYGQEFADVATWVQAYHVASGRVVRVDRTACAFRYRDSRFKAESAAWVVLRVGLQLRRGAPPCLAYPQVRQELAQTPAPSLNEVRQAVLTLRRHKSMVIDEGDPNSKSCGSFFVNPIVAVARAHSAVAKLALGDEKPPLWPTGDGLAKLSAAWLIERSGLHKGQGQGPVGLSAKHTLALINRGGATAADVLQFATLVQQTVLSRCGIELEREPVLLGQA